MNINATPNTYKSTNGRYYVMGEEICAEHVEKDTIDYGTLSRLVGDMVLNNTIHSCSLESDCWEEFNGSEYDEETDEYTDIYQEYIISEQGAEFLRDYTDQLVFYNPVLDVYLWAITHYGTAWSYVYTEFKYVFREEN